METLIGLIAMAALVLILFVALAVVESKQIKLRKDRDAHKRLSEYRIEMNKLNESHLTAHEEIIVELRHKLSKLQDELRLLKAEGEAHATNSTHYQQLWDKAGDQIEQYERELNGLYRGNRGEALKVAMQLAQDKDTAEDIIKTAGIIDAFLSNKEVV